MSIRRSRPEQFESPLVTLRPGQRFIGDTGEEHERAGPRRRLAVDPGHSRIGLLTCGGACPGLNTVVRGAVLELIHAYGVPEIFGFRFGFQGLTPNGVEAMRLNAAAVRHIHRLGGSLLGMSRGRQEDAVMADFLARLEIDAVIAIGGDGTMRGAHALAEELLRRGQPCSVVGVPKSIDNDIALIDQTFGVATAVDVAKIAIDAAHAEASSVPRGVGIVKLMGRDSGYIAACATCASMEVNFCLIPEVPVALDGPGGLLEALEARLSEREHAVIVVAEGCAENLGLHGGERDASGNMRYSSAELDVGICLRERIASHFEAAGRPVSMKYIDPSYLVRSGAPDAQDSVLADALGRGAVHAAMAGRTDVLVGPVGGLLRHLPLAEVTSRRRRVEPSGELWNAVLEATGQGALLRPRTQ